METRNQFSRVADSLKFCENPELKHNGYRAISFMKPRYLMLYRIERTTVYVEAIYHQLQEDENIVADKLSL